MQFSPVRDLIAHAGSKLNAATIAQFGVESAGETQENVPFLAPMVRAVIGRVLHHANPNRAELACAPVRRAGFTGMLRRGDRRPVGDTKWDVSDLHVERPGSASW